MADDSAELVVGGRSRRVAMDIARIEPKAGVGSSVPPGSQPGPETAIEGEIHDQEDLNGVTGAALKVDGVGEFKIDFYTPTRFRGVFVPPAGH